MINTCSLGPAQPHHLSQPSPLCDRQNLANNTLAITNLNNLTGAKSKKKLPVQPSNN